MGRDPVKNRANVAKHTKKVKERRVRTIDIMEEFLKYVKREPIQDAAGQLVGYACRVEGPEDFHQRWEAFAADHGMTAQELLDDSMVIYFEEVRRLKDERN